MSRNIALTIQYNGARFDGWQRQGNTDKTIQSRLEAVLSRMTGHPVELHGSGRTDAGVHAAAQIANFHTDCDLPCPDIMRYVNQYLPRDIAVTDVREAAPRFHARLSATGKRYRYRCRISPVPDVFARPFVWELCRELDIGEMHRAAGMLVGQHDFAAFCGRKIKKSTVRNLRSIEISEAGGEVVLDFEGDGFLYHMVRILTGTLVEVGLGERCADDMPALLAGRDRSHCGTLAPAEGLCLMEVTYD
jgi:tRNA pseudouridine38-40 synthase